jgi:hypothetical protein
LGQLAATETKSGDRLFVSSFTEVTLTVHALDLKREARRSKRKAVLMRATLIGTDGAQTVRLRDLTSEGAGIACQAPLRSGSDVILRRGDLFIAARVVWAEGMTAGLEFYRPLTGEWLELVAQASQPIFR